jgi:hypothetical protein
MHRLMFDEVPPDDGHRKTILFPQHTHVGFGIAMQGRRLSLDELYLSRYVEMDPVPRQAKIKTRLLISGKMIYRNHVLNSIEMFYEPLPSPPAIEWLREPRSYGMPEVDQRHWPLLPYRYSYPDGSKGSIELDSSRRFRVRVDLSKKPGINTVIVGIKAGLNGTPFPATQICIRVE